MVENSVNEFTTKMKDLLQIEREAEIEETANILSLYSFRELEKRNLAITKLFVKHVATGVYGRVLLHLTRGTKKGAISDKAAVNKHPKEEGSENPQQKLRIFSPGDIVGLYQSDRYNGASGGNSVDGVVYKVTNEELVIAFNEMHEFVSEYYNCVLTSSVGIDEATVVCGKARK